MIQHILSGKVFSHALRVHFLVHAAFLVKLVKPMLEILLQDLLNGSATAENIVNCI